MSDENENLFNPIEFFGEFNTTDVFETVFERIAETVFEPVLEQFTSGFALRGAESGTNSENAFIDYDVASQQNILNFFTNLRNEEENMSIAECYIKEWCKSTYISFSLKRVCISLWKNTNKFPTLDEIVSHFNSNPCLCSADMVDDERKAMIRMCLINEGNEPSCRFSMIFNYYKLIHNALPVYNTVIQIIDRMDNDDNSYFDDKVNVGTKNLEHIQTYICDNDSTYNCSLCMDNIIKDQKYYKLEPCGHIFHANDDDCIGSTIIKWLTDNHTCPNCRKDVIIKSGSSSAGIYESSSSSAGVYESSSSSNCSKE